MKLKISCVDPDHPFANPGCYLCRARSAVRGRVAVCQVQKRTRVMRRAQASKNVGKSDVGSAVASGAVVSGALCASPALTAQQVASLALADMPSAAGTMNGSLPAIATLLFIFLATAFLIILYVKNPGTE